MQISVDRRRARYLSFVLLALAIHAIDGIVTRSVTAEQRPAVLAAASFDIVVVVMGLYYWLLIRPGMRSPWSSIPNRNWKN